MADPQAINSAGNQTTVQQGETTTSVPSDVMKDNSTPPPQPFSTEPSSTLQTDTQEPLFHKALDTGTASIASYDEIGKVLLYGRPLVTFRDIVNFDPAVTKVRDSNTAADMVKPPRISFLQEALNETDIFQGAKHITGGIMQAGHHESKQYGKVVKIQEERARFDAQRAVLLRQTKEINEQINITNYALLLDPQGQQKHNKRLEEEAKVRDEYLQALVMLVDARATSVYREFKESTLCLAQQFSQVMFHVGMDMLELFAQSATTKETLEFKELLVIYLGYLNDKKRATVTPDTIQFLKARCPASLDFIPASLEHFQRKESLQPATQDQEDTLLSMVTLWMTLQFWFLYHFGCTCSDDVLCHHIVLFSRVLNELNPGYSHLAALQASSNKLITTLRLVCLMIET